MVASWAHLGDRRGKAVDRPLGERNGRRLDDRSFGHHPPSLVKGRAAAGRWQTHALLAVVQLAFASQAVEAKIAMSPREVGGEAIPPAALAMSRMLGAAVFFQLLTRATGWLRPTSCKDHIELVGLSVLGIA